MFINYRELLETYLCKHYIYQNYIYPALKDTDPCSEEKRLSSIWAAMGQNKPPPRLPPASWAWPRWVSLEKGRVLIGRGVKGGGNRIVKWCVLIGSLYTRPRFDWFAPYLPKRWRGWVVEGLR